MNRRTWAWIGLGVGLVYLLQPGRSAATIVQEVKGWGTGTLRLTTAQAAMKALIESTFTAAGMGWAAPAAVANAWGESRLDPLAEGDSGHSIGLFQLNDGAGAAGAGMTVAARQSPTTNTARILQVAAGSADFLASRGGTHAEVTRAFARYVENCALCGPGMPDAELRVRYLRQLYPSALADTVAT
jgi:hypothetical protein